MILQEVLDSISKLISDSKSEYEASHILNKLRFHSIECYKQKINSSSNGELIIIKTIFDNLKLFENKTISLISLVYEINKQTNISIEIIENVILSRQDLFSIIDLEKKRFVKLL